MPISATPIGKLVDQPILRKRTLKPVVLGVSFGSFAEIDDTPKAAVRAAPIEGEADLAIQQKRPFASGKFQ